jgi:hypothetical protein
MSTPELIVCILAGIILIPALLIPFVVQAGTRAGIVKTGQETNE